MRSFRLIAALLILALVPAWAQSREEKLYLDVLKLDGTSMVSRAKDQKPEALQTKEVVERGDTLTVYEKSWVLLKSPKGDLVGVAGPAKVVFEEIYKGGSDRQLRILLNQGNLYLKSVRAGSRQSFFEVAAAGLVVQLERCKLMVAHDPAKKRVEVQFHDGNTKTLVVDAEGEQVFPFRECKRVWENGKMTAEDPLPLDAKEILAFKDFFQGHLPRIR